MSNPDGLLCFFEKKYANASSNLATKFSDPVDNTKLTIGRLNDLLLDDGFYNIYMNSILKFIIRVYSSGQEVIIEQDDDNISFDNAGKQSIGTSFYGDSTKSINVNLTNEIEGSLSVSIEKNISYTSPSGPTHIIVVNSAMLNNSTATNITTKIRFKGSSDNWQAWESNVSDSLEHEYSIPTGFFDLIDASDIRIQKVDNSSTFDVQYIEIRRNSATGHILRYYDSDNSENNITSTQGIITFKHNDGSTSPGNWGQVNLYTTNSPININSIYGNKIYIRVHWIQQ